MPILLTTFYSGIYSENRTEDELENMVIMNYKQQQSQTLKVMKTYNVFSCRCIIVTPHFHRTIQKNCAFIIPTYILINLKRMFFDLIKLVNNLP